MYDVGTFVDRYQVERVIGNDAAAVVYGVRHTMLGSRHALKLLTRNSQSADKALQGARDQATLHHAHIVAITDILHVASRVGLVMELVEGGSLEAYVANERPPLDAGLRIFRGVVRGVRFAHERRVLHGGLAMRRVLLDRTDGRLVPKVTGFGVEGAIPAGPDALDDVSRIAGLPPRLDTDGDLAQLGAILYELLTGRRPSAGSHPDPRTLVPSIPEPIAQMAEALVHGDHLAVPHCQAILERLDRFLDLDDRGTGEGAAPTSLAPSIAALGSTETRRTKAQLVVSQNDDVDTDAPTDPGASSSGAGTGVAAIEMAGERIGPLPPPMPLVDDGDDGDAREDESSPTPMGGVRSLPPDDSLPPVARAASRRPAKWLVLSVLVLAPILGLLASWQMRAPQTQPAAEETAPATQAATIPETEPAQVEAPVAAAPQPPIDPVAHRGGGGRRSAQACPRERARDPAERRGNGGHAPSGGNTGSEARRTSAGCDRSERAGETERNDPPRGRRVADLDRDARRVGLSGRKRSARDLQGEGAVRGRGSSAGRQGHREARCGDGAPLHSRGDRVPVARMVSILFALLVGCADPRDTLLPDDAASWETDAAFQKAIGELEEDEQARLVAFKERYRPGGPMGDGGWIARTTIRRALEEQVRFSGPGGGGGGAAGCEGRRARSAPRLDAGDHRPATPRRRGEGRVARRRAEPALRALPSRQSGRAGGGRLQGQGPRLEGPAPDRRDPGPVRRFDRRPVARRVALRLRRRPDERLPTDSRHDARGEPPGRVEPRADRLPGRRDAHHRVGAAAGREPAKPCSIECPKPSGIAMSKKQPPTSHRPVDDLFEERTVVLSRNPLPELSGLMRGDSMDLPFDDAVDLEDADMESVSDASIDDIVLTEEELIATGGFRLGQLRAIPDTTKSRVQKMPKSPPPPARTQAKSAQPTRLPKTPPKAGVPVKTAKPAPKKAATKGKAEPKAAKAAAQLQNDVWAVEAQRLIARWLPDLRDTELVRAHQVNQRESQERLWEKHRARFGAKQDLSRAIASAAVAEALRTVPTDQLVALELRCGTRYFLVWIDLFDQRPVAVLSDLKVS